MFKRRPGGLPYPHRPSGVPATSSPDAKLPFGEDWQWDEDPGQTVVADGGYQQFNAPDRPAEDGWYWDADANEFDPTMEIEGTCQYILPDAPIAVDLTQESFTADDDYEDPTTDLAESSSGPVQANAPPLDPTQDDPWPWANDDVADDWQETTYQTDADPIVDDPWPWAIEDDATDPWPLDDVLSGDAVVAADAAQDDAPEFQDVDDELAPESSPVGDDQPALQAESYDEPDLDDEPWWFDILAFGADAIVSADQPAQDDPDFPDAVDDGVDESAPVGPDAIDQPQQADADFAEDVGDEAIDESTVVGANAAAVQDQPTQETWWEDEALDDQPDESAPVAADALDAATQEAWVEDEATDELVDESSPVGADAAAQLDQPQPDTWLEDDFSDEPADESAPVGSDAVLADQPQSDAWAEDDLTDELADESMPVADSDLAQSDDATLFDEAAEDPLLQDDVLGADEPPIAAGDAWDFDAENVEDELPPSDQASVDLVLLAGPTYEIDWDYGVDDTADDDWWAEQPQPDPAGLPVDTCPAQLAAAMAQIADLQAQLAAAMANAGGGGAGGDGDDNIGVRSREEDIQDRILSGRRQAKRARIAQQNALIMALVGATVHGLKGPKEPK